MFIDESNGTNEIILVDNCDKPPMESIMWNLQVIFYCFSFTVVAKILNGDLLKCAV